VYHVTQRFQQPDTLSLLPQVIHSSTEGSDFHTPTYVTEHSFDIALVRVYFEGRVLNIVSSESKWSTAGPLQLAVLSDTSPTLGVPLPLKTKV
jgi:hypothetical protein